MKLSAKLKVEGGFLKLTITYGNGFLQCATTKVPLSAIDSNGGGTDIHLVDVTEDVVNGRLLFVMSNGSTIPADLKLLLPSFLNNNPNNVLKINVGTGKLEVVPNETVLDAFGAPQFKAFSL